MTPIEITFDQVHKIYTRSEKGFILAKKTREKILDSISFTAAPGAVTGIIGSSGSGKTVLARLAAGDEKPTEGTIRINGNAVSAMSSKESKAFRKQVAFVSQDAHITLDSNANAAKIVFGSDPTTVSDTAASDAATIAGAVKKALSLVGIPPEAAERKSTEFSGGQRQLLTIAAALVQDTPVIIADQPLNALDPSTKIRIAGLFQQLAHEHNKTVILIAHQLDIMSRFTDRLIVLEEGTIIEQGTTADIFDAPTHESTKKLLQSHFNVMSLPAILARRQQMLQK